jgi:hypothetical protein
LTGAVAGCFFARVLAAQGNSEAPGLAAAALVGVILPPLARNRLPGEAYLLIAAALVVALAFGL